MKILTGQISAAGSDGAERTVPVPEHIAAAAVPLFAGWVAPAFEAPGGGPFVWNDGELNTTTVGAREEHGILEIQTTYDEVLEEKFRKHELRNKACSGTLSNGLRFNARMGHVAKIGGAAHFRCNYWMVSSGGALPAVWVARLTLHERSRESLWNVMVHLQVAGPEAERTRHMGPLMLRLKGQYEYYLILQREGRNDSSLIIDTLGAGPPEREVLHPEFVAIQFVLGQRLHLGALAGLNQSGRVVAYAGGPYGFERERGTIKSTTPESPVGTSPEPKKWREAGKHAAVLFNRLVTAEREHPEYGLLAAMALYVTALGDILEGSALKLHVGIEGLASKMRKIEAAKTKKGASSKKAKTLYLSNDHAEWLSWCDSRKVEIETMTRSDAKEEVIFQAVRRADNPGASQVVPIMLEYYGIPLTDEIRRVLDARNELVHEARLPAEDDFDRLVHHGSVPRTLLIALMSKAIGYDGPILGYNLACPDWWAMSKTLPEEYDFRYSLEAEMTDEEWRSYAASGS